MFFQEPFTTVLFKIHFGTFKTQRHYASCRSFKAPDTPGQWQEGENGFRERLCNMKLPHKLRSNLELSHKSSLIQKLFKFREKGGLKLNMLNF